MRLFVSVTFRTVLTVSVSSCITAFCLHHMTYCQWGLLCFITRLVFYSAPILHGRVSASLWCSGIHWGPEAPQADLAHFVIMGYGCFTQLAFKIQLKGKIQVSL